MNFPTPKKRALPTKKHVEREVKQYINAADQSREEPGAGLDEDEQLSFDFQLRINRWERALLQWIAKRERRSMRWTMREILRLCLQEELRAWKAEKGPFLMISGPKSYLNWQGEGPHK